MLAIIWCRISLSSSLLSKILKFYIGVKMVAHMREEHRLKVFETGVLRRIFGPRRDEVRRKWRKLHNVELNDLYSSPNIVWL